MKTDRMRTPGRLAAIVVSLSLAGLGLAACTGSGDGLDLAKAKVSAKEKAVAQAESDLTAASATFCDAGKTYIEALDRYGDVLHETAPTVGDVRDAGSDLAAPRDNAFDGAETAVKARQTLITAQQELADAQAALAAAQAGTTETPTAATPQTSPTPLAPTASAERVKQAESDFATAQAGITDQTPLKEASIQFNSAALALEMAWLQLFSDAGCMTDDQQQQATAAITAYTTALQQDLAATGYYKGTVDGIYGPATAQAVEDLQKASGLPTTGWMDKATSDALQQQLLALGGEAAQKSVASTAAVQQTLKLLGFWDGPVDGVWTPALTEAVKKFQTELGVTPSGVVDAATIAAFEKAVADFQAGATPTPTPSDEPTPESTDG